MAISEAELGQLLERYTETTVIHQECMRALVDATASGAGPTTDLAAAERRCHDDLAAVRRRLIHALTPRAG